MKNQQLKEIQKLNNFDTKVKRIFIFYLDGMARALIGFFVIGLGLYAFLYYYFKIPFIYILPILFLVSISLSPFLSKIKIGEKIVNKYERFLLNMFIRK